MRGRFDRDENASSQLAEKVSAEGKKVEDLAQRMTTEEETAKGLVHFAVQNEVSQLNNCSKYDAERFHYRLKIVNSLPDLCPKVRER